jgi:hypothetical protein
MVQHRPVSIGDCQVMIPGRIGAKPARAASAGLLLFAGLSLSGASGAPPLAPYKDDLFENHVVRTLYGGDYRFIEYSRDRDLYGRDEVVEKRAFAKYVSLDPNRVQSDLVLKAGGRTVRYVGVGKTAGNARFVVVFLHGDRGSRFQAVDDWSFGGNFNRLKNLVVRNDGVYLSADFANFGRNGANDILALMKAYAAKSPEAPIIVACTSRSGELCFRLIADRDAAPLLAGVVLLGTGNEDSFFESPAFTEPSRRVPIFIGHGSGDSLLTWVTQELFFKKVKAAEPDYPIRLDVYVDGAHGTPMRLIDWRLVLNWMISLGPNAKDNVVTPVASPRH